MKYNENILSRAAEKKPKRNLAWASLSPTRPNYALFARQNWSIRSGDGGILSYQSAMSLEADFMDSSGLLHDL